MQRNELLNYLNEFLDISAFKDICPNGLQVEGRDNVNKIVTAVSAGVELFEKAAACKADAVLVHHGIILDFERPIYKGGYKKRVKILLENDINLFAYHLPLDAHPEIGNNILLAQKLGLSNCQPFADSRGQFIGFRGDTGGISAESFFEKIKDLVNDQALIFPFGKDTINSAGIISGGAQKDVKQAVEENLDLYLTGEVSEHIMNYVKEEGIHFAAAGHYATERFGITALGEHLAQKFGLDAEFIDIPNPA